MFQFKETYVNNPTTYDELERFISIYNPSEVILISNLPDEKEMDYIISYAGINCNLIHKIYDGCVNTNHGKHEPSKHEPGKHESGKHEPGKHNQ
jgi:hypothetical protein